MPKKKNIEQLVYQIWDPHSQGYHPFTGEKLLQLLVKRDDLPKTRCLRISLEKLPYYIQEDLMTGCDVDHDFDTYVRISLKSLFEFLTWIDHRSFNQSREILYKANLIETTMDYEKLIHDIQLQDHT